MPLPAGLPEPDLMVFAKRLREGIRRGRITISIRIWTRLQVKVGGRYPMEDGHIVVDSIVPMKLRDISHDLARESGFASVKDLLSVARHGRGRHVYLIRFHYLPPGGWDTPPSGVDAVDRAWRRGLDRQRDRSSRAAPVRFTSSDAWLLFAVALAATAGKVALKDVIACGDAINHAIFAPAELRRGFAKLMACGHISRRGRYFEVSPEVRGIIARAAHRRTAMHTLQKQFENFLSAAPHPAGDPQAEDPAWRFPQLTDAMVDRAVHAYRNEFQRRGRRKR